MEQPPYSSGHELEVKVAETSTGSSSGADGR